MTVHQPGEDVGEVGGRIDAVELPVLHQGDQDRPVMGALVGAGEDAHRRRRRSGRRDWAEAPQPAKAGAERQAARRPIKSEPDIDIPRINLPVRLADRSV
jgi:hypothetical protein